NSHDDDPVTMVKLNSDAWATIAAHAPAATLPALAGVATIPRRAVRCLAFPALVAALAGVAEAAVDAAQQQQCSGAASVTSAAAAATAARVAIDMADAAFLQLALAVGASTPAAHVEGSPATMTAAPVAVVVCSDVAPRVAGAAARLWSAMVRLLSIMTMMPAALAGDWRGRVWRGGSSLAGLASALPDAEVAGALVQAQSAMGLLPLLLLRRAHGVTLGDLLVPSVAILRHRGVSARGGADACALWDEIQGRLFAGTTDRSRAVVAAAAVLPGLGRLVGLVDRTRWIGCFLWTVGGNMHYGPLEWFLGSLDTSGIDLILDYLDEARGGFCGCCSYCGLNKHAGDASTDKSIDPVPAADLGTEWTAVPYGCLYRHLLLGDDDTSRKWATFYDGPERILAQPSRSWMEAVAQMLRAIISSSRLHQQRKAVLCQLVYFGHFATRAAASAQSPTDGVCGVGPYAALACDLYGGYLRKIGDLQTRGAVAERAAEDDPDLHALSEECWRQVGHDLPVGMVSILLREMGDARALELWQEALSGRQRLVFDQPPFRGIRAASDAMETALSSLETTGQDGAALAAFAAHTPSDVKAQIGSFLRKAILRSRTSLSDRVRAASAAIDLFDEDCVPALVRLAQTALVDPSSGGAAPTGAWQTPAIGMAGTAAPAGRREQQLPPGIALLLAVLRRWVPAGAPLRQVLALTPGPPPAPPSRRGVRGRGGPRPPQPPQPAPPDDPARIRLGLSPTNALRLLEAAVGEDSDGGGDAVLEQCLR
ncbi:hypothetical protein HK405_011535, partial [Cladochytrium tenue]